MTGYEIERKFLIAMPTDKEKAKCIGSRIVQTYLLSSEGSERVRKRVTKDKTEYTHTRKITLSPIKRIEEESVIGEEEYEHLLLRRDKKRRSIDKVRYKFPYRSHIFEIDVYPFWDDAAVLEVEMSDEKEEIVFPEWIRIIREITDDMRFTNSALALQIPDIEDIIEDIKDNIKHKT